MAMHESIDRERINNLCMQIYRLYYVIKIMLNSILLSHKYIL